MKIDDFALAEAIREALVNEPEGGEVVCLAHAAKLELSRQLTAAGAPPGDLEQQLRALLARPAPIEPGAERIGRTEEETGVRVESAIETAYACNGCGLFASGPNDPCAQCDVPRLEAILAAKDARAHEEKLMRQNAQRDAEALREQLEQERTRIRELEAQLAARPIGIPDPPPPPPPPSAIGFDYSMYSTEQLHVEWTLSSPGTQRYVAIHDELQRREVRS